MISAVRAEFIASGAIRPAHALSPVEMTMPYTPRLLALPFLPLDTRAVVSATASIAGEVDDELALANPRHPKKPRWPLRVSR